MNSIENFFNENPRSFEILLLILWVIGGILIYYFYFDCGQRPGGLIKNRIVRKIGQFILSFMMCFGIAFLAFILWHILRIVWFVYI